MLALPKYLHRSELTYESETLHDIQKTYGECQEDLNKAHKAKKY